MHLKGLGCALRRAVGRALQTNEATRVNALTPGVFTGSALVAVTLIGAVTPINPARADGISFSVPTGTCASWTLGGTATSPTLTCIPPTSSPGAPAGCSLTASPSSISAATNVTLTATCSSNVDSTTTWAWTGTGVAANGPSGATSQQIVQGVAATTTFTAQATTAGVQGLAKGATVTFTAPGSGGGGGGGAISCPGYATTTVLPLSYVPGSQQVVRQTAALSPGQILVVTFTTPAAIAAGYGQNGLAGVSHNYYASPSAGFSATFSKTPCKTTYSSWANADGSSTKTGAPGQSVSWSFNTYKLAPNTTYYLNVTGDSPLWVNLTAK